MRRGSTQKIGIITAMSVGAISAGVLGWLVWTSPRPAPAGASDQDQPIAALPPPNIMDLTPTTGGQGFRIELMDRAMPQRRSTLIRAARIDPLEGSDYRVSEPRVFMYLRDGRSVYITADSGVFTSPKVEEPPERGTLSGKVTARLFAAQPGGLAAPADPDSAVPLITSTTDTLDFDAVLGELTWPGLLTLTDGRTTFTGVGGRLVLDEPRQGVRSLVVRRDIRISTREGPATPSGQSGSREGRAGSALERQPAPGAVETLYRVSLAGVVTLRAGEIAGKADRVEAAVRLFDNSLRPGAVGDLFTPARQPAAAPSPAAPDVTPAHSPTHGDELTVVAAGPLEISPAVIAPTELAKDDVHIRLRSSGGQGVSFKDARRKLDAAAAHAEYFATRRVGVLTSDVAHPMEVELGGAGSLRGPAMSLTVDAAQGVVGADGAGTLAADPRDDRQPARTIRWTDRADFVFETEGSRLTDRLKESIFAGGVEATDGRGRSLVGDLAHAWFDTTTGTPQLRRLKTQGKAKVTDAARPGARDDDPGSLAGESMLMEFMDVRGQPALTAITVSGEARASSRGSAVSGDLIEAALEPTPADGPGASEVISAQVQGRATLESRGGVRAGGDLIVADVRAQKADVLGVGAFVARGPSTVRGETIHLTNAPRGIRVEGPGRFDHTSTADGVTLASHAEWRTGMTFDDPSGVLEAFGAARGEAATSPMSVDKFEAERVRLELSPGPVGAAEPSAADVLGSAAGVSAGVHASRGPTDASGSEDRAVRRVVLRAADDPASPPAKVESREYAPGEVGAPRVLARLLYAEGRELIGDNDAGTIRVPTAGKLLAVDRRAATGVPPVGASLAGAMGRGTALFEWTGSLNFDRNTGAVDLARGVKITHERRADGVVTYVEAEEARAVLAGTCPDSTGAMPDNAGELLSATASGPVYVRTRALGQPERELSAWRIGFDAGKGLIDAAAAEGGLVTLYDAGSATPVQAPRLNWDVATGRVEIVEPRPIVSPR